MLLQQKIGLCHLVSRLLLVLYIVKTFEEANVLINYHHHTSSPGRYRNAPLIKRSYIILVEVTIIKNANGTTSQGITDMISYDLYHMEETVL
jgi:hypothetical protein